MSPVRGRPADRPPPLVRVPPSAPAQVRASLRRLGVRDGSRAWAISAGDALRIAAGLPASRDAVAAVLARIASTAAAPPEERGR